MVLAAALLIGLSLAATQNSDPAALPDEQLLRLAEDAFAEGMRRRSEPEKARKSFARSAYYYDRLRRRGCDSVELLRNLGNAALVADELPAAVLAYRRALERAPHDTEVREALEYARSQVQYPGPDNRGRPQPDAWPPWLPRPALGLVLLAAAALYGWGCVVLTRWLALRRGLGLSMVLFGCGFALGFVWVWFQTVGWSDARAGLVVVTAEEVALSRGNGPSYPANYKLPRVARGMEARLLHRRGGWAQVEFPGGHIGWLPESAALVDQPE